MQLIPFSLVLLLTISPLSSFAAPIPRGARTTAVDPVAVALASKIANINKQIGRFPVVNGGNTKPPTGRATPDAKRPAKSTRAVVVLAAPTIEPRRISPTIKNPKDSHAFSKTATIKIATPTKPPQAVIPNPKHTTKTRTKTSIKIATITGGPGKIIVPIVPHPGEGNHGGPGRYTPIASEH